MPSTVDELDARVRAAAFAYLGEQRLLHGDNGLALCSLHHAAFDAHILGVRPDCVIELRRDVLEEADGPMLQHALQGFHGKPLVVPRADALKPRREFLEERYATFKKAG